MNKYRIKSKFLYAINEAIKTISLTEEDSSYTDPAMDSDGNFYTDVTSKNEPKASHGTEVNKLQSSEEQKEELMAKAIEKLRNSLDVISALDDIINEIKTLDSKASNEWEMNKEQNDLYLQSKDAHIFKQNDNLMLSHNGKIENFKSVASLKAWLKSNDYPEVPAVTLYESVK